MVKTLHFHCRGHRFGPLFPGQGTKIPLASWQKKKKKEDFIYLFFVVVVAFFFFKPETLY